MHRVLLVASFVVAVPSGATSASEPVASVADVEANVARAAGTRPQHERTITDFTAYGLSGTQTCERSGDDDRCDTTYGPFRYAEGDVRGMHWRQNENGEVILGSTRLSNQSTMDATLTRVAPADRYVLSRLDRAGYGVVRYVDPQTWHVVREEYIRASGTQVVLYDDFRTTAGSTRAWNRSESDGHAENAASYQIRSIDAGPVSQAELAIPMPRKLVEFPTGVTAVPLPVQLDGDNHFIVRIDVGGRGLDFLIDSGASGIVMDRDVLQQLGIREYGYSSEGGGAGRYVGTHAIVPAMSVGTLKLRDVVVSTTPHVGVDSRDVRVVGLLGFDFIDAMVLKLDYSKGAATAFAPGSFAAPTDPGTMALDVRLGTGLPFTDVRINDALGTRFALDTGASGEILIFDYFRRRHPGAVVDIEGRTDRTQTFGGVGGTFETQEIGLAKFAIGDETYARLIADVVTTPHAYTGNMDGVIGPGLFTIFTLYADYAHDKVYLVPSDPALVSGRGN